MALGVIVLLVVGATGLYLYSSSSAKSSSTGSSSAVSSTGISSNSTSHFKVNYDTLTVGYNSGLWSLSLTSNGGKNVKLLQATLHTPTESKLCTGELGGFYFANCPPTPPSTASGYFPSNATFTGYASGAGAGSAKLGSTYTVTLSVTFSDGTTATDTLMVTATSS